MGLKTVRILKSCNIRIMFKSVSVHTKGMSTRIRLRPLVHCAASVRLGSHDIFAAMVTSGRFRKQPRSLHSAKPMMIYPQQQNAP